MKSATWKLAPIALAVVAGSASATVAVQIVVVDGVRSQTVVEQRPIAHAVSLDIGGSFGSAAIDLRTGILRTASITRVVLNSNDESVASAAVNLTDTLTFAAGASGTAFLDWGFDGSIDFEPLRPGPGTPSYGQLSFLITPSDGGPQVAVTAARVTTASDCSGAAPSNCVTGPFERAQVAMRGSLPFAIRPGTFTVAAGLGTFTRWGDDAHFENTSYLYLRVPEGVTFTSGSGVFLLNAVPVPAPVPEPSTALLLLVGVLGLALRVRRPNGTFFRDHRPKEAKLNQRRLDLCVR